MRPRLGWVARMIPGLQRDIETMAREIAEQNHRLREMAEHRETVEEAYESLQNAIDIREDDWWMLGDSQERDEA